MSSLANIGYLPILKPDGTYSYGGSQMWFDDSWRNFPDYNRNRWGCGLVALGNLILYLMMQKHGKDGLPLDQKSYMEFLKKIQNSCAPVYGPLGLIGPELAAAFNKLAKEEGVGLRAKWGKVKYKDMLVEIRSMLKKDIPAIIGIGPDMNSNGVSESVTFYKQYSNSKYRKFNDVKGHYVTATEIIDKTDRLNGGLGIMIKTSSWGEIYYIDGEEFIKYAQNHNQLLTNILLVE